MNITWSKVASVTIDADKTSDVIVVSPTERGCSIQLAWTGGVGTIKAQASNDKSQWNDLDDVTDNVSGAGNTMWVIKDIYFPYLRVVFTFSSSTGVLTGTYNTKNG